MRKNIFEVNEEEKNRIIEMHINATSQMYLVEQLDPKYRAKQDWPKIANLLISYGATCYIQEDPDGLKKTKTSSGTQLYKRGQSTPTYCVLPLKNVGEKYNDPNYKQYSTYNNEITFQQWGYYQKTVRGYQKGSGNYSLNNKMTNLIDNTTQEELITSTAGGKSTCPFTGESEIKMFRLWLNTQKREIASKFKVEKDRTDCTAQVIQAAYYIQNDTELYKIFRTYMSKITNSEEFYNQMAKASKEDALQYANPDATKVIATTGPMAGKELGTSHQDMIQVKDQIGVKLFDPTTGMPIIYSEDGVRLTNRDKGKVKKSDWEQMFQHLVDSGYDPDVLINVVSAVIEFIPEGGALISFGIDFVHALTYFARAMFRRDPKVAATDYLMGMVQISIGAVPLTGNITMVTLEKTVEKIVSSQFKKLLENSPKLAAKIGSNIEIFATLYKVYKLFTSDPKPQKVGTYIVATGQKVQELYDWVIANDEYMPDDFKEGVMRALDIFAASKDWNDDDWNEFDKLIEKA